MAADDFEIGSSRSARHTILPIVGYQYQNGVQTGLDWDVTFQTTGEFGFEDSTFHHSGSFRNTDDLEPPILGLLYRYRLNEKMLLQGSAIVIQDRSRREYPVTFEFFGFTQRHQFSIERRNSNWLNAGGAYEFDTPLNWLSGIAQLDLGMAFREIRRESTMMVDAYELKLVEDEKLFTVRGGVDMTLWKDDNLIMQFGFNYAQFIPMETDADPYGGLGWRFSVFPVWSDR